jgi:hypothetical protein
VLSGDFKQTNVQVDATWVHFGTALVEIVKYRSSLTTIDDCAQLRDPYTPNYSALIWVSTAADQQKRTRRSVISSHLQGLNIWISTFPRYQYHPSNHLIVHGRKICFLEFYHVVQCEWWRWRMVDQCAIRCSNSNLRLWTPVTAVTGGQSMGGVTWLS